jgi:hypothetical protein
MWKSGPIGRKLGPSTRPTVLTLPARTDAGDTKASEHLEKVVHPMRRERPQAEPDSAPAFMKVARGGCAGGAQATHSLREERVLGVRNGLHKDGWTGSHGWRGQPARTRAAIGVGAVLPWRMPGGTEATHAQTTHRIVHYKLGAHR